MTGSSAEYRGCFYVILAVAAIAFLVVAGLLCSGIVAYGSMADDQLTGERIGALVVAMASWLTGLVATFVGMSAFPFPTRVSEQTQVNVAIGACLLVSAATGYAGWHAGFWFFTH